MSAGIGEQTITNNACVIPRQTHSNHYEGRTARLLAMLKQTVKVMVKVVVNVTMTMTMMPWLPNSCSDSVMITVMKMHLTILNCTLYSKFE